MKPFRATSNIFVLLSVFVFLFPCRTIAEQLPLKRAVELALAHGSTMQASQIEEQRAFASYLELRNQYLPQLVVGSGLGKSWGYPLSLEGSAPSIVNTTAQSALLNPALREFMHAAKSEMQETAMQTKDQRNQVIEDTVVSYAELSKWEALMTRLSQEYADSLNMEQIVNQRIAAGIDNPLLRNQARLNAARVYLHVSQAQGAIDVLQNHLSQLTGLPAPAIETVADSIPAFPDVKQEDNLAALAAKESPLIQIADIRATALAFRARGEHKALWPTVDFAAQYSLRSTYNNYQDFFRPGSFQRHNATVGVAIRFPFLSATQRAHAQAADQQALHAKKGVEATRNQVSEQTLKLQRSVEQLAAAQQVVDLEYQIAKSNLDAIQIKLDAGTATLHDLDDARSQANERYNVLQDASFDLSRTRIALLRATGELGNWVGIGK